MEPMNLAIPVLTFAATFLITALQRWSWRAAFLSAAGLATVLMMAGWQAPPDLPESTRVWLGAVGGGAAVWAADHAGSRRRSADKTTA
jgi:hypothetical protein